MTPELLQEYRKFCEIREKSKKSNVIDLSSYSFFHPTSMLLLADFLIDNKSSMEYIPPSPSVQNYISTVMKKSYSEGATYMPIVDLPQDKNQSNKIIDKLQNLHNNGKDYGGRNAFTYLIGELIDNIYQHSEFSNASVMAQRYGKRGFVEITIFDDGISIPTCFEKGGHNFSYDCYAIVDALHGKSTKHDVERGHGLRSLVNLYIEGIGGELLLVSRNGAVYKKKSEEKCYNAEGTYELSGTLVSIRIRYPAPVVDIYGYIEG